MLRSLIRAAFMSAVLVMTLTRRGEAQQPPRQDITPRSAGPAALVPSQPGTPPTRTRVFAINPLGIPFEVVSVEFEAGLQGAFTLAGNFSYFSPDDFTR